jgi:hypothetical protein
MEVNKMKYAKPEVTLINVAMAAIQGSGKTGIAFDNPALRTHVTVPAYEADE